MWLFRSENGPSVFSSSNPAEEVTNGIDAFALTAIITVMPLLLLQCVTVSVCRSFVHVFVDEIASAMGIVSNFSNDVQMSLPR
ncbi:hypothetical protein C5167_027735 [Papaver somniferum]|nr:hypothetical protein C5167_027735 [Papaver somniferum]